MAALISIKTNFQDVAKQLKKVSDDIGKKAIVRALNTTIQQGQTEMARSISKEYRMTVGVAKKRLKVTRASAKGPLAFEAKLEATRRMKGRSMNVIQFVTGSRNPKGGRQLGFKIKRGGPVKRIPGAFVANNGRTVFVREGKKRLPIAPKSTIDIPQMFNARRINQAVRASIIKRFQGNFDRELRAVLGGFAK